MGSGFFRNKAVFWVVVLVLLFVLVVLVKISSTPTGNLSKKSAIPTPTAITAGLCASFATDKGEISCAEAMKIALKKYPGQLVSIDKTIRHYESGNPPKTQTKEAKVWIINLKPDDQSIFPPVPKNTANVKFQTTDTIGVVVSRATQEILFYEPVFKK
jgi:hypothetical protein